jgi:hypothetical protein
MCPRDKNGTLDLSGVDIIALAKEHGYKTLKCEGCVDDGQSQLKEIP